MNHRTFEEIDAYMLLTEYGYDLFDLEIDKCDFCGKTKEVEIYEKDGFEVKICQKCEQIKWNKPTIKWIAKTWIQLYSWLEAKEE